MWAALFLTVSIFMVSPFVANAQNQLFFPRLTVKEARHVNLPEIEHPIIAEFQAWAGSSTTNAALTDVHKRAHTFCATRHLRCEWQEFHSLLSLLRVPFGQIQHQEPLLGKNIKTLVDTTRGAIKDCARIDSITASNFHNIVKSNRPIILTQSGVEQWKALSKWTLKYLDTQAGKNQVVASAAPDGIYDAPVDPSQWNLGDGPPVLARPGQLQLTFSEFIAFLRKNAKKQAGPSLYLEYFPLPLLFNTSGSPNGILNDLGDLPFANFLAPIHRLIW
jgi:hypothetical protein